MCDHFSIMLASFFWYQKRETGKVFVTNIIRQDKLINVECCLSSDSVTRQVSTDPAPSTSGTPAHYPRPPPAELLQLVNIPLFYILFHSMVSKLGFRTLFFFVLKAKCVQLKIKTILKCQTSLNT